ncbi:MAG: hypothetical protein LBB84_10525 [Tannerellaceae bacterium]|jgi:ribosomal protein S8|nr:hypothetical protein [Tannerellaceae bacterium]
MKFTEAKLEQTFAELLQNEGYLHNFSICPSASIPWGMDIEEPKSFWADPTLDGHVFSFVSHYFVYFCSYNHQVRYR